MNVVVQIDGREAVPVRAIPLLTYWDVADPRTIVQSLAGLKDDWERSFLGLTAYRVESGELKAVTPLWWETNCLPELHALSARLAALEEENTITHETAKQQWRSGCLELLPAGVFVWKDELVRCFQQEYGSGRWSLIRNGEELTSEQAAVRTRPDFDPFLSSDIHEVAMAGFDRLDIAPKSPRKPATFEELLGFAEGYTRTALGEHVWDAWARLPNVGPSDAALLVDRVDPDSAEGRSGPSRLRLQTMEAIASDGRPRRLMEWLADLIRFEQGAQTRPADDPISLPTTPAADACASVHISGDGRVVHTTRTARRDAITPVIEQAQERCKNPKDVAEVWGNLLAMAEQKVGPLRGAAEEGIQYLKNGDVEFLSRDAVRARISRQAGR